VALYDQETEYIRYEIGDIVREREWIIVSDFPLCGIVVNIEREIYQHVDWLPHREDRLHVFWFKWSHIEMLPGCFVEIVSKK